MPAPASGIVREPPIGIDDVLSNSDTSEQTSYDASNGATPGASNSPVAPERLAAEDLKSIKWSGDIPMQKWMTFYTRILSPLALSKGVKLTLNVEISPDEGISQQKVDQLRAGLRDLGLSSEMEFE